MELKGERVALREARKHAAWYMKGWRGAASLRAQAGQLTCMDDVYALCARAIQEQENEPA